MAIVATSGRKGDLKLPQTYPAGHPLHAVSLKNKQRELRSGFAEPLTLRVHRALSWLLRAEDEDDDQDVRFILLWIGFNIVWQRFSQEIRVLLDNKYVFAPFWAYHNGADEHADWAEKLDRAYHSSRHALEAQDTPKILSIVFDRLYVLRNQLVHGGATWNSKVNREQVRDGAAILGCLLPVFVDLMMDNPQEPWAMPHYPVVN